MRGKGAAQIVILIVPRTNGFVNVRHYRFVAAVAAGIRTHIVMNFLASVQAEHQGNPLFIQEAKLLVSQQHRIGSQRQFDFLAGFLLSASHVGSQLFYHFKIHQRLAAKKVDFQMTATAAFFQEKINSFFAYFRRHQASAMSEVASTGKAVAAAQIAVMGHMQAQRLKDRFRLKGRRNLQRRCKQLFRGNQLMQLGKRFAQFVFAVLLR